MGKYMFHGSYTAEGTRGVMREGGTARVTTVEAAIRSVGGRLEFFYFGFGKDSFYTIVDLPDNTSAAALSMAVAAGGGATVSTVVLLTPAEVDAAAKITSTYRAPGQ